MTVLTDQGGEYRNKDLVGKSGRINKRSWTGGNEKVKEWDGRGVEKRRPGGQGSDVIGVGEVKQKSEKIKKRRRLKGEQYLI